MPRDLFAEAGISPAATNTPRDLFAEAGVAPTKTQPPSQIASSARDLLIGGPGYAALKLGGKGLDALSSKWSQATDWAAGKAQEGATAIGLPAEGAGVAGAAVKTAGEAIPMALGGGIGAKAAPFIEGRANWLMNSAIKPSLEHLKSGEAARAVQTMFDEGINASKGGIENVQNRISDLNNQIKTAISNSPATVNKQSVAQRLNGVDNTFMNQVDPIKDLQNINTTRDNFLFNHPALTGVNDIPVAQAQAMKQGTYKQINNKYGEIGSAETEAQKALARGLKEEIATAVPEISGLNSQESKLINVLNVAERRILLEGNKNPAGLSLLAHNPATWAAFMADKSALFKSLAARMINANATAIPTGAGAAVGSLPGLLQQPKNQGLLSQ
jgi:hypothetical protein